MVSSVCAVIMTGLLVNRERGLLRGGGRVRLKKKESRRPTEGKESTLLRERGGELVVWWEEEGGQLL